MTTLYIEVDGIPVPESDVVAWARWFDAARRVALDHEQDRYASRAAALAGHAAMVSRVRRWAWTRWIPSPLRRAVLAWSDAR